MTRRGTYNGDELYAEFTGQSDWADYGPGTPVTEEITDIEITAVCVLGAQLPLSAITPALRADLLDLAHQGRVEWSEK